jgi:hypothetical protein
MKKLLAIIAAMLAIINVAHAYDFESGGIYYNITSDNTVAVTFGGEYTDDVIIPEKVTYSDTEYSVTSIGDFAFSGYPSLTSIELPSSLVEIGIMAFYNCSSLINIELPSSVNDIGYYAFYGCSSLINIEIPSSVVSIGVSAFQNCSSLQEISVSEVNENYASVDGVLYNKEVSTLICCPCGKSGDFTVPSSVTSIGYAAFSGCTSLTSIELPSSLKTIGGDAFKGCSSLTSIEIPSSVTSIGNVYPLFNNCTSLQQISVASDNLNFASVDGVLYFKDLSTLICCPCGKSGELSISSSVKYINDLAFYNCTSLTSIELPSSVDYIDYSAFCRCTSLTKVISLNPEPPTLGSDVFESCPIETVYVPADAVTAYQAADDWKNYNIQDVATTGIPSNFEVEGIYYKVTSFTNKNLKVTSGDTEYSGDVVIPEKVAYSGIEFSVTSIGERAFNWCTSLKSIVLPSSVTSIDEWAFYNCRSLTSIELPSSLISIGERAFESCKSLQEISVSEANENFTSIDGILYDKNVSTLVCCPGGKSGEFTVQSSVTTIGNYAFADCGSLTSIKLPSPVTTIGYGAFLYCYSLVSIELSSSLTSIDYYAFCDCRSLTSIELPSSLISIGERPFAGCESLQEIFVSEGNENYTSVDGVLYDKNVSTLVCCPGGKSGTFSVPSSVTSIGNDAFSYCYSLTSIEIPSSVTEIGGFAFRYCSSLVSINLPASLTSIGNEAFLGCRSLTSIELPSTVTKIDYSAFMECRSLTSIELPASLTSIEYSAFNRCESLKTVISLNPEPPTLRYNVFENSPIETVYVPTEAVSAYQSAEGWSEFNIVGMSNVGDEEVPVYVVSDIVEEEGTVQEAREEVSFDFVEYSEVATGQGTATLTREGSSEVVILPAAQIAGEATQARALRVVAADGKDYQVVQPLGNAATAAGNYTIHFPEGYFLLGTQKENSPAFTMSFTVGDMSGITDAIINSADAEYYTLQGVKVQGKPAPGIYICRQGNKATKVVVK